MLFRPGTNFAIKSALAPWLVSVSAPFRTQVSGSIASRHTTVPASASAAASDRLRRPFPARAPAPRRSGSPGIGGTNCSRTIPPKRAG